MTGLKEMEKMEELVIGIDLCDTYTKICCFEEEKAWTVPTVICKKKETDQWFVGKEAYGLMLTGTGVMVDKLVSLASKGGTATIEGVCYSAGELLERFLEKVLEFPKREYGAEKIAQLAVSLSRVDSAVIDALLKCADALKLPRQRLHIISHTEGFVYYAMSQKKEVWATQVGLFDLSDEGLFYYELKAQRGIRGMVVQAEGRPMEESFNLDILENASGARMADRILCSCGERLLQKKLFSAVFLTGKGFEKLDWAENFRKFLCSKRKVYGESELFARGAAYYAADFKRPKTAYPFACICEGRLKATVAMAVRQKEREIQLVMASAGDSWYDARSSVEVIAEGQDYVDLTITPLDVKKKRTVRIPLEGFPDRLDRTTRLGVSVGFLDENTMAVAIEDKGFGELFPATDAVVRREVRM